METRSLYIHIRQELSTHKPMIFLAGPQQAGKTTLTHLISKAFSNYFVPERKLGKSRNTEI